MATAPAASGPIHEKHLGCQMARMLTGRYLHRFPRPGSRTVRAFGGRVVYGCRGVLRPGEFDPYLHVLCVSRRGNGAFWFDTGS